MKIKDYVSDRVFDGKRSLTPERSNMLREKIEMDEPKLIGHTRKSPLHAPDLSVYKTDKVTMIKVSKYNPSNISLRMDNRIVPQLIELLQQCVEQKKPDVAAIKEQYKNAERDFLKNCQSIHGKEEGLRQYNEIMERERQNEN